MPYGVHSMNVHQQTKQYQHQLGLHLIIKDCLKLIQLEVLIYYLEKKDKGSLLLSDFTIDESNWYQAKQFLAKTYRGRDILNWAENHLETKSNT